MFDTCIDSGIWWMKKMSTPTLAIAINTPTITATCGTKADIKSPALEIPGAAVSALRTVRNTIKQ